MLLKSGVICLPAILPVRRLLSLIAVAFIATAAMAQSPAAEPFFARKNTFSFFGAYSNDSSPILLGEAENRKLLDIGAAYGRRLYLNRIVNWQYNGEILPVALESDPVVNTAMVYTLPVNVTFHGTDVPVGACVPSSGSITETQNGITYSFTYTNTCSRRWNIGEAMSPVGMQWNFLPRKKMQPFLIGHGGYMYSTQPIPIDRAGSFNFTFDLGAGIELYRSHTRSIRAEYRYHHISNHETAMENPGIDNGLLQVTYSFGH